MSHQLNPENFENTTIEHNIASQIGKVNKGLSSIITLDDSLIGSISYKVYHNTLEVLHTDNILKAIDRYNQL